ncbi:MAG: hypothetical protein IPJ54_01495 [Saprospiraceae bacterium]|nr:hypothetical protein [Saprospiraceae bacterium]
MAFISREAMSKIKDLERSKLVLPTKNVAYKKNLTLTHSIRRTIYEFFKKRDDGTNFLETVHWLIFELYNSPTDEYNLSSCPHCHERNVTVRRTDFNSDYISNSCKICNNDIFITDIFRLHEAIDNELGAGES